MFIVCKNNMLNVTPLAGVWIEIKCYVCLINEILSLPLRECGLKFRMYMDGDYVQAVTPLAGVWIEII